MREKITDPKEIRRLLRKMRFAEEIELQAASAFGAGSEERERARKVKLYWTDRWYDTGFPIVRASKEEVTATIERWESEIKRIEAER